MVDNRNRRFKRKTRVQEGIIIFGGTTLDSYDTESQSFFILPLYACWFVWGCVNASQPFVRIASREHFHVLAIAGSAFLLCGGGLGCWVSVKDSTCLQAVFVYLLVIVFCLIGTAAALAYNSTDKVDSDLAPFREVFENYTGNRENPDSNTVDAIQEELQCCGINDYRDWLNTTWFNKTGNHEVPHSCCNTSVHNCNGTVNLPSLLYSKGCRVKLREAVIFVLRLMIISSFAVLLFLVCALFSVAQLMRDQHLVEYQILS